MVGLVNEDGSIKNRVEVIEVKKEDELVSELVYMAKCNSIRIFGYYMEKDTEQLRIGIRELKYYKFLYKLGDRYIGCSFGRCEGNGLEDWILLYNNYIDRGYEKYVKEILDIISERYKTQIRINVNYGGPYVQFDSKQRERLLESVGAEVACKTYIYKRDAN